MDEDKNFPPVPWYAYQREIARADTRDKRIIKAIVAVVVTAFAAVAVLVGVMTYQQRQFTRALQAQEERWISFIEQYDIDSYTETYTQDGRGLNLIGSGNEVDYHGPDFAQEKSDP